MKWEEAIEHCTNRPIDAYYQDGDNLETPLYLACQNCPTLAVVQALLLANPTAVYERSRVNGDIPLHIACKYNASIEVLRELVQANPGTVSQPTKWGCTPIRALWDGRMHHQESFTGTESTFFPPSSSNQNPYHGCERSDSVFWDKVDVLLEAVAYNRQLKSFQSTDTTLYIVHAAVSLGSMACPFEIIQYCIQKHPEQVRMKDPNGQLPLHIAVESPVKYSSTTTAGKTIGSSSSTDVDTSSSRNNRQKKVVNHWSTRNNNYNNKVICRNDGRIINLLLELYPESSSILDPTEPNGRYPLHTALLTNYSWKSGVVQKLVKCSPQLLTVLDPIERLYPFQLAQAENAIDVDATCTSYELLCMDPSIVCRHTAPFQGK